MADDYSPTIKSAASKLGASGAHVHRTGELIRALPGTIALPVTQKVPDQTPASGGSWFHTIDGFRVINWIAVRVEWARGDVWNGKVLSGYRSDSEQADACRHVCGNPNGCPGTCAKPGTSNHRYKAYPGGAVDVSDRDNFERAMSRWPGTHPLINALPNDLGHFSLTGH